MEPTLDPDRLQALAEELSPSYAAAVPFPHIVIDDFLPEDVASALLEEFPGPTDAKWLEFDSPRERKLASLDETYMGPITRRVLAELNSATAIEFLQTLTGISGLVPDPHFFGGGQHQIVTGGMLEVHADFNIHPGTRLERRLNLLLYLNRDWPESYGGSLEFWSSLDSGPHATIAPLYNRCVVFSTTSTSFHGHPKPLMCPPERTRKSLALYYYSLPVTPDARAHNTIFRGVAAPVPAPPPARRSARTVAARWAPPALVDAVRRLRDKRAARVS